MKFVYAVLVVSMLGLSSCTTTDAVDAKVALPELVQYDKDYRKAFASELREYCGNPSEGIADKLPKLCTFVRDQLELRKQLKAMKGD